MSDAYATRLYAPDEADQLVPHLEAAFARIEVRRTALQALVERLQTFGVDLSQAISDAVRAVPEVMQLMESALAEHRAIVAEVQGLAELGVEVKALDGLCDVRSEHDGRIVYLCWRRGEARFGHWHELDTGFAGRQVIARPDDFVGTLLN